MTWEAEKFLIATSCGPSLIAGYVYRGLGIFMAVQGSPKGRRKPEWALTHLGSGHRIVTISGTVAEAFPIASKIAEAGDWTFDDMHGYKNQFPEAKERVVEIMALYPKQVKHKGGPQHEGVAREIAMTRS